MGLREWLDPSSEAKSKFDEIAQLQSKLEEAAWSSGYLRGYRRALTDLRLGVLPLNGDPEGHILTVREMDRAVAWAEMGRTDD